MKKGSALLLVLGMLSFMVISAVAFSAFMRYSRLPSSYLRRSSSSRQLVKAALAEAIDIVDAAIADNPHPGVGYKTIRYPRRTGGYKPPESQEQTRNHWRNHVFTGTNYLVSAADTVSTLTLEGLAYLPPALINEVRYYSRHSTAAMWHSFGYDSGRFAFCAVDVSDHFDVNRIPVDIGRGSAPGNRFSLAYVFEGKDHTSYTVNPSSWDSFMENFVSFDSVKADLKPPAQKGSSSSSESGSGNKLPLVSVADLNLAVNRDGTQFKQYFPFVSYVTGASDDYVTSETSASAEMQRHMAFVTDGYFPSSGGSSDDDDYDLADDQYQPFTGESLKENNQKNLMKFLDNSMSSKKGYERIFSCISSLGMANLWDYLDEDNVPVSLAIPSVERTPMVCGIKPTMNGSSIKVEATIWDEALSQQNPNIEDAGYAGAYPQSARTTPSAAGLQRVARYVKKYTIDKAQFTAGIRSGSIKAVVAYPFLRGRDLKDPDSFTIDGHVEFFLSSGSMKFRTGNKDDVLHMEDEGRLGRTASQYAGNGVFDVPLASQSCTFSNVAEEQDAVKEFDLMMGPGASAIGNAIDANPLLTVTWEQAQQSVDLNAGNPSQPPNLVWQNVNGALECRNATCGLPPIMDGKVDPDFESQDKILAFVRANGSKQVRLCMAVWLRIKNGDGKTVDLVPAHYLDDKAFNGINVPNQLLSGPPRTISGNFHPLMRFACGSAFDFSEAAFASMTPVAADVEQPNGVICADPRWNWAPEHWFSPGAEVTKDSWLQNCGKGVGDRDRDIFMATSDAGYMQSVYELAFLPRLVANDFKPANALYGSIDSPDDDRVDWATGIAGARNSGLMWMTYRPFAYGSGGWRDDFAAVGLVNDGGAMKLNPYSDNENILVSAFANTPESWWAASANTTDTGLSTSERTAKKFNEKYAWSEMNSDAKFAWKDLQNVASAFRAKMQAQTAVNGWEDAYDDLWELDGSNADSLMGAKLENDTDDLYGVDRKFLYGYWRDCFAVKQQLFLIFVRAEPMMMGGGIIGQTPPQLGARAVALVWRNPHRGSKSYSESDDGGSSAPEYAPHQTRVLFYRQFD